MGKHRHHKKYRRTVVAAAALGVIGIPSVAMACTDWPGGGQRQDTAAADDRRDRTDRFRPWSGQDEEPTAAPSRTPSATASPSRDGAPKRDGADSSHESQKTQKPHKSHKPKKAAPGASASTPASRPTTAAPKPAAGAPKPTSTASKPAAGAPEPTAPAPEPTTAAPEPTTGAPTPAPTGGAEASGAVAEVVALVNTERSKVGCSPVKVNATLTEAAQKHSEDMAASRTMSHTGSDGSSPAERITRAGYDWSTYGENVAYGYSTPEKVMAGWMASPGHKENILNCAFKEIGVGLAQPGSYWTQNFGTAR